MTYSLVLGGTRHFPLATIRGWRNFKSEIDKISFEEYDQLVTLAEHGICQELESLSLQTQHFIALAHILKLSEDIIGIAKAIISCVNSRRPDDVSVFVTDGMGKPDTGNAEKRRLETRGEV